MRSSIEVAAGLVLRPVDPRGCILTPRDHDLACFSGEAGGRTSPWPQLPSIGSEQMRGDLEGQHSLSVAGSLLSSPLDDWNCRIGRDFSVFQSSLNAVSWDATPAIPLKPTEIPQSACSGPVQKERGSSARGVLLPSKSLIPKRSPVAHYWSSLTDTINDNIEGN